MPAEIIVRGVSEVRVMPDHASIRVAVDGDGADEGEAYEAAAGRAAAVDAVIEARAAVLGRVMTAGLTVQPKSRWRKGESQRTGWRASRSTLIEVTTPDEVGGLVADLARAGGAVGGPWWEIDPANPAHGAVRAGAAEDARRRAESYAAGLGVAVGDVTWIAEPGLRSGATARGGWDLESVTGAGADEEGQPMAVATSEITLTAEVEVCFALRQQDGTRAPEG